MSEYCSDCNFERCICHLFDPKKKKNKNYLNIEIDDNSEEVTNSTESFDEDEVDFEDIEEQEDDLFDDIDNMGMTENNSED